MNIDGFKKMYIQSELLNVQWSSTMHKVQYQNM